MISAENKTKVVVDHQSHKTDTGSPAVQAGIATARIKELTEHLKTNKKDHSARRALLQLVGQRKKNLKYISDKSVDDYTKLVAKLGIRR